MSAPLTPPKRPNDQSLNGKGKRQKTTPVQKKIVRLLCPSSRTGSVLGEGEEAGVKVVAEDAVAGCDERVIVIGGSDEGMGSVAKPDAEGEDKENAAVGEASSKSVDQVASLQRALFLVFERMVGVEQGDGGGEQESKKPSAMLFSLRLLVLSSQIGCVLGKGGSVIKRMASESGAQIRILPRDKLPACASASDEVVQITGEVDAVRKALQSVSRQILENPQKDHESTPPPKSEVGLPASGARGVQHAAGPRELIESGIPSRLKPTQDVLTFRLLCLDERVGGLIGKGGTIIKGLQHETGCEIKVLEGVPDTEDRIIVIYGPARPDDRVSPPQEAVLRVQTRLTEGKEKVVGARMLVSSDQIGCLLGKGGSIMTEMRKSSGASIRILGKDQIPKCASEGEVVVQINGEREAVQDALLQITTRLRHQFFRAVFPPTDHLSNNAYPDQMPPFAPFLRRRELSPQFHSFPSFDGLNAAPPQHGFHPHDEHYPSMHNVPRHGMLPPFPEKRPWGIQGPSEINYAALSDFPHRRMPSLGGLRHSPIITNTTVEVVVPRSVVPTIYGEDGACLNQILEISDAEIKIMDPAPGAQESKIVISGTPEQTHAAQSLIQAFVMSARKRVTWFWQLKFGIQRGWELKKCKVAEAWKLAFQRVFGVTYDSHIKFLLC